MDLVVVESAEIDAGTRAALRVLWDRAFGDRFSDDDADHAYGGVHVLMRDGDRLVGHASAVPRRLRFGDGPWCTWVTSRASRPTQYTRARASAGA